MPQQPQKFSDAQRRTITQTVDFAANNALRALDPSEEDARILAKSPNFAGYMQEVLKRDFRQFLEMEKCRAKKEEAQSAA